MREPHERSPSDHSLAPRTGSMMKRLFTVYPRSSTIGNHKHSPWLTRVEIEVFQG